VAPVSLGCVRLMRPVERLGEDLREVKSTAWGTQWNGRVLSVVGVRPLGCYTPAIHYNLLT
jgi:hypothetical protein